MFTSPEHMVALVKSVSLFPQMAEKIAEAPGCQFAQQIGAVGADQLYNVMLKEACAWGTGPTHQRVVSYVCKLAELTGKPEVPREIQYKLAAVVIADEALSTVIASQENTKTAAEYSDLFGMQSFGREFAVNLLQGVL